MSLKNLNTRRLHADRAMPIRVYNTLSRKKEEFVPLHANRVSMFVCGLTPQDETHMGHAKTYVAFDVVARFLRHKGFHVFYLQNVTDIEDRIIEKMQKTGREWKDIVNRYFGEYLEVMDALRCNSVDVYAFATDYIEDIAITIRHFGPQYDLHGGATELMFPHHEAEIAQAEAYTGITPFVKYWMHGGMVTVKGEEMHKSLGNYWPVKAALKLYEPEVIRFFLINVQYRGPIDFAPELLDEAKRSYERLRETMRTVEAERRRAPDAGEADHSLRVATAKATADRIRDAVAAVGVILEDTRDGVRWKRK